MATDRLGLYVHIPYCVKKCNYCDFCSLPTGANGVSDAYVRRLCDEIGEYRDLVTSPLSTVYFGGGTPSLLTPLQLERIVDTIHSVFDILPGAELSFEANPGTVTEEIGSSFRSAGFNRVSLGLQSIHEKEMKILGRIHNLEDFDMAYSILRRVGFDNINVDLMYGIPHQTPESFRATLEYVCAVAPEHVSAYGLIVEEGTSFYRNRESLNLPDADTESDMYELCKSVLASHGYSHYEISNYARPGYESRHNLLYWRMDDYIGVGASAHSFYRGKRYFNTDNVPEYIDSVGIGYTDAKITDREDEMYEYAMLALRLREGLSLTDYEARFGISFLEGKQKLANRLIREGLCEIKDGRFSLTERGFYVSNSILVEIL